ncbi:glycosyltransferase family 4 protein [Clostridium sp. BSD2780061688st1 E8]|uniref:glycosyltransferase n=1 Tax=unclassified Clostridium TaxID=2614128 RepID=UPI00110696C9
MVGMKLLYIENEASINATSFYVAAAHAAEMLNIEFHIVFNCWDRTSENVQQLQRDMKLIFHQIDFIRNPLHPGNWKAYRQLCALMEREQYDLVHCNTPVGGLLGRLAAKKCGIKKVIYQAHGFHFYRGAPKLNWLLYYPVERWLARWTDVLITINQEDFALARRFKLRGEGKTYFVPGVGIDLAQWNVQVDRDKVRREVGLNQDQMMLISMGDLIRRKDYETAIRAIAAAHDQRLQYYICGKGPMEEKLRALCENLQVTDQVHFLGYRQDIKELLQAADLFLFTSRQEGLARSLMEAMASGLPAVCTQIRGNVDLIEDGVGGYLVPVGDSKAFAEKITILAADREKAQQMGRANREKIKRYSLETVEAELQSIYEMLLNRAPGGREAG